MEKKHPVLAAIAERKSVRNFTGAAVYEETLAEIVRAGMAAPSAVNTQPWEFVVVTNRTALNALADALPYAKMLYQAGAAIVVCADSNQAHHRMTEFAVLDSTLASENILLAAEALGLGAIWTAAYPYPERMEPVRTILRIPETVIPLNVIPVGHPTGQDVPKDKFKPEKIHREVW
jgi:nitroreductase